MINPYAVLRVKRDSTKEEIEEAYYRMRRLVSVGTMVSEADLQEAFAILSDPDRRSRADERLRKQAGAVATQAVGQSSTSWFRTRRRR